MRWDHDGLDAEFARDRYGMSRPAAPVGKEHELTRIVSLLNRHLTDGLRHVRVGNFDDAESSPGHLEVERLRNIPRDRVFGTLDGEADITTQKIGRI